MKRAWLLLALLAWHAPAAAGTCTLLTPVSGGTLLDFGTYTAGGSAVDRSALLTLVCLPTGLQLSVPYTLRFDAGTGGGTFSPRKLRAGGYTLNYNLYRDASRTLIWGNGTGGFSAVSGSCVATCAIPVYGRLAGGQVAPAAAYSDSVTLTVEF